MVVIETNFCTKNDMERGLEINFINHVLFILAEIE